MELEILKQVMKKYLFVSVTNFIVIYKSIKLIKKIFTNRFFFQNMSFFNYLANTLSKSTFKAKRCFLLICFYF